MFIILHIFIPHVEIHHSHSKQMKMSCQICCLLLCYFQILITASKYRYPTLLSECLYCLVWFKEEAYVVWPFLFMSTLDCKQKKLQSLLHRLNVHIDIKIYNILNNCTYNSSYLLPCTVLQNNISLTVDRSWKTLVPESRKRQTQTYSKSLLIIINNITVIAAHGLE